MTNRIVSTTGIAIEIARASNHVTRTRAASLAELNHVHRMDNEQLPAAAREQARTRVGSAMVVYGD